MKKLLVLAALSLAAAPALASKARLASLGQAGHLLDTQSIFTNASDLWALGDYATLEMGGTNTAAPNAEGGFMRTMSFGKVGVYLGHRDASYASVFASAANGLTNEQNPLDLFYGMEAGGLKYAFNLHYTNYKTETTSAKGNATALSAAVRGDVWNAYLTLGLGAKAGDKDFANTATIKSNSMIRTGGRYTDGTITYVANVISNSRETQASPAVKTDVNNINVGMINTTGEKSEFFYGLGLNVNETKTGDNKTNVTTLPLLIGIEADAASWMVLRGSVTQSVLISERKTKTGATTNKDVMQADTVVAAGVGLKFNKLMLDAGLTGATTGTINTTSLLANAAVTYMF